MYSTLLLLCYILSFIYNKKDALKKRHLKSFLHTFCIAVSSLYFAFNFFASRHDVQDLHPNLPILQTFDILGNTLMYGIPLLYVIEALVVMKIDKKA